MDEHEQRAIQQIRKHGTVTLRQCRKQLGITPRTIYALQRLGIIERTDDNSVRLTKEYADAKR